MYIYIYVYMHHVHLFSRCPYHYILMNKALHQLGTIGWDCPSTQDFRTLQEQQRARSVPDPLRGRDRSE